MEQYDHVAQLSAQLVTNNYSSSFSLATRAFPKAMRIHIYNIYGLVRVGDEIVDTYIGDDQRRQLDNLETEVYQAIERGYSSNLIVHAFQLTAVRYGIGRSLIEPFFMSMRTDIAQQTFTHFEYDNYIHGSAGVVGLMCLKVFVDDQPTYDHLQPGAEALGAAFQKVNFLRDLEHDYNTLQRFYFPGTSYKNFDDIAKQAVIDDIRQDFVTAKAALEQLPPKVRTPVMAAYRYYVALLQKLNNATVAQIKSQRIRINDGHKIAILTGTIVKHRVVSGGRS